MYSVRIYIDTDGDFGYDDPEFMVNGRTDEERIFYFEKRTDAVRAIIRSFNNLKNTLRPYGRDHIKRWVDSMDHRIELICQKFKSFTIEKSFGNQSITYELLETQVIKMDNGSSTYVSNFPDVNFSWYEEEQILWDEVVKMSNVDE